MMKTCCRTGLFIYDGAWASSLFIALELFQSVNLRLKKPLFQCDVLTPEAKPALLFHGHQFAGDDHIGNDRQYDLILLAHYWGDFDHVTAQYPHVCDWLLRQYQGGATLAGINGGVFWLAEAGLLNGRRATTFWRNYKIFKTRYPDTTWVENQALVEDGGIYSSNGQNAATDLCIYMVEKFSDAPVMAALEKDFMYDNHRNYDLTLFNIAGLRQHHDQGVHKAQDWLEGNYPNKVELEKLADQIGMSKRTFIRRFQKATCYTPSRYLQCLRTEAAKQRLINSDDSVKTIGSYVGYNDVAHFTQVFKSTTGLTPSQYRKQVRLFKPIGKQ